MKKKFNTKRFLAMAGAAVLIAGCVPATIQAEGVAPVETVIEETKAEVAPQTEGAETEATEDAVVSEIEAATVEEGETTPVEEETGDIEEEATVEDVVNSNYNDTEKQVLETAKATDGIVTFYVFQHKTSEVPDFINTGFPTQDFVTGDWLTLNVDLNKFFAIEGINAEYNASGWWYATVANSDLKGSTTEEKLDDFWAKLVSCMDEETQALVANTNFRAYSVKKETVAPHIDGITVNPKTGSSSEDKTGSGDDTTAGTTPATGVTPVTTVTDTTTPATTPSTTVADTTATDTTVTPAEVTEITDGDVPLAAADDVADVDLEDEDVPLAATPDTEDTTILDEATPLADGADATEVAKTGDSILLYAFFSVLGLAGIITVTAFGRKRAR